MHMNKTEIEMICFISNNEFIELCQAQSSKSFDYKQFDEQVATNGIVAIEP